MITYSPYYLIELRKRLGGKLKSLLGKVITNGGDSNWSLNINGTGELIANIDFPAPAFISTQKNLTVNENHYYYYFSGNTDENIQLSYYTNAGFYAKGYGAVVKGSNIQTLQPIWRFMTGLKKGNYHLTPFILDLTQAKLDTLTAEQVYDLLTLNGTDFTDLELLSAGYEIKLGNFGATTEVNVDMGDLTWNTTNIGGNRVYASVSQKITRIDEIDGYTKTTNSTSTMPNNTYKLQNNYVYFANNYGSNGWKNYVKGKKVYYNITSGALIKGSKYGFVKLKDLSWYGMDATSHRFYSYDLDTSIKKVSLTIQPNVFSDGFVSRTARESWEGTHTDKTICVGSDGFLGIIDTDCDGVNVLKEKYGEQYIVYELNTSLGNKLDNYTAEQVYYMFFATLGMNKMYVPQGVRFESSDNIILGTKYGIRDINLGDDWSYYAGYDGANCHTIQGLKLMPSQELSNVHLDRFKQIQDWRFNENRQEDDYVFAINIYGNAKIRVRGLTTSQQYNDFLKGKYLIYELATPNGTDYNDLSAKEMYDVINDNAIDILANGKSIGGVRSIVGKQNTLSQIGTSTTGWSLWLSNNSFGVSNIEPLSASIINGHKYFCLIKFKSLQDNFKITVGTYNPILLKDENRNSLCAEQYNNYWSDMCISTINTANANGTLGCILWANNGGNFDFSLDIPESYLIIDLTANNLDTLTAQEAYQYFKEHNLKTLVDSGELKIGGYIKPEQITVEFYIKDDTFTALEGMTWAEFVNSTYNEGRFSIVDGFVVIDDGNKVSNEDYLAVSPDDIIQNGYTYYV